MRENRYRTKVTPKRMLLVNMQLINTKPALKRISWEMFLSVRGRRALTITMPTVK
jgi:hypothetical protein